MSLAQYSAINFDSYPSATIKLINAKRTFPRNKEPLEEFQGAHSFLKFNHGTLNIIKLVIQDYAKNQRFKKSPLQTARIKRGLEGKLAMQRQKSIEKCPSLETNRSLASEELTEYFFFSEHEGSLPHSQQPCPIPIQINHNHDLHSHFLGDPF
jgi:hypothetical protein